MKYVALIIFHPLTRSSKFWLWLVKSYPQQVPFVLFSFFISKSSVRLNMNLSAKAKFLKQAKMHLIICYHKCHNFIHIHLYMPMYKQVYTHIHTPGIYNIKELNDYLLGTNKIESKAILFLSSCFNIVTLIFNIFLILKYSIGKTSRKKYTIKQLNTLEYSAEHTGVFFGFKDLVCKIYS